MSSGEACRQRDHRPYWLVIQRRYHMSAFSGYRRTPSPYSLVRCRSCDAVWRTKAAYVDDLPGDRPAYMTDHQKGEAQ